MDGSPDYREDVYLWSQHQAALLRGLDRSAVRLPNELDLENIAEEVEGVGASELNAVSSHLMLAMTHIIKMAVLPGTLPVLHWLGEVENHRDDAQTRFTPGMRRNLDMEKLWTRAQRRARTDLLQHGDALPPLPEACPFTAEELLDLEQPTNMLVARLAATRVP